MKISRLLVLGTLVAALCIPAMGATPPLTGDVPTDFTGAGILTIADPVGDVGVPPGIPGTTGWELADLRLTYNAATDTMYVGLNAVAILGDADGDALPGGTSVWLAGLGGTDNADLGGSETTAVYFDLDSDGLLPSTGWDVIAGVSGATNVAGFSVNVFSGVFNPPANFGAALPANIGVHSASPSAGSPDFEFTITNWSTLPGQAGTPLASFRVGAFIGSIEDDGIGEDFIIYQQSPTTITTITATPTSTPSGGSVSLEVKEENDGLVPLTNVQVVVTKNAAAHATLIAPPDSGDAVNPGALDPGEEWIWTISSGAITVDPTDFVATGSGIAPGDFLITYPADAQEQDTARVTIEVPDTDIDIKANGSDGPITVCEGATVTLTICEENTGLLDLTDPYVELYAGATLIGTFDETDTEFTGVDGADLGVLDAGETWCWDVDVVVADPTTTFTTIGYGHLGSTLVTWCENPTSPPQDTICDEDEIDQVIVETEECGAFCTFTQGFWGNKGGRGCGEKTDDLIDALLAPALGGDVVVGLPGNSITLGSSDCIIDLLPAGGKPGPISPAGDYGCDESGVALPDIPGDLKGKQGRFNNVLIGQVVALTLNLRLYGYGCTADVDDLAAWVLPAEFCTIGDDGCPEKFYIPALLVGLDVTELLALANAALAGEDISPATIGQIYDAVTALNEGFDECREVVDCGPGVEICLNGCDDDFDGTVDELDCVIP